MRSDRAVGGCQTTLPPRTRCFSPASRAAGRSQGVGSSPEAVYKYTLIALLAGSSRSFVVRVRGVPQSNLEERTTLTQPLFSSGKLCCACYLIRQNDLADVPGPWVPIASS